MIDFKKPYHLAETHPANETDESFKTLAYFAIMGGDNVLNIAIASLAIAVGLVSINQIFAALRTEELRQQLKRKK